MFFNSPEQRPNPLSLMLQSAGESSTNRYLQEHQHGLENERIQNAFKDMDENTSPLQVLTKISGLNVSPDKKTVLLEGFKNISSQKALLQKEMIKQSRNTQQQEKKEEDTDLLEEEMIARGLPRAWAKLYAKTTEGGRTQILKDYLQARARTGSGLISPEISQGEQVPEQMQEEVPIPQEVFSREQANERPDIIADVDKGLTPQERVKREESRYKQQLPIYNDYVNRTKGLEEEFMKMGALENLNESGNLESGLQRWNINGYGDVRFPFLASAETQLYSKILKEFLANAKDTFGARLTNFDVSQFLQKLPGLQNDVNGRRAIIEQMKIMNRLNKMHYQASLDEVNKAGGVRKIDFSEASKRAEKNIERETNLLKRQFNDLDKYVETLSNEKTKLAKSKAPSGFVLMLDKDGEYQYVDKRDAHRARKEEGYKSL